ncbi:MULTISPECIES: hypothetical protein [Moorena]|uniref:hypothetical protein n=1 Tax=Moorena TaxID=1155738 RepID=UPI001301409B|nr:MULTISPECIES: hypothetical protein [Moorena]NEO12412.1 hypothetical protein [Moorena sp. SIO3E8]NEO43098.1 hypothetical protein [Moorena sp. SIO4A3]NEP97570.1 hypothetical protein [Moorena sp. SIO3F7]
MGVSIFAIDLGQKVTLREWSRFRQSPTLLEVRLTVGHATRSHSLRANSLGAKS